MSLSKTASKLHRRTIIKGAAWSVPVIASAVSAPLAAASNEPVDDGFTPGVPDYVTLPIRHNDQLTGKPHASWVQISLPSELVLAVPAGITAGSSMSIVVTISAPDTKISDGKSAYGLNVHKLGTLAETDGTRTSQYASKSAGFPSNTYKASLPVPPSEDGAIRLPIEWELHGNANSSAKLTEDVRFLVTVVAMFQDGSQTTVTTTLVVPGGAGILTNEPPKKN